MHHSDGIGTLSLFYRLPEEITRHYNAGSIEEISVRGRVGQEIYKVVANSMECTWEFNGRWNITRNARVT